MNLELRGLLGDYEKLKKDEIAHFGGSAAGMILKVPSQSYCSSDIGIENSMRSLVSVQMDCYRWKRLNWKF